MSGSRESLWHINDSAFQVFNKKHKLNRLTAASLVKKALPISQLQGQQFHQSAGKQKSLSWRHGLLGQKKQ